MRYFLICEIEPSEKGRTAVFVQVAAAVTVVAVHVHFHWVCPSVLEGAGQYNLYPRQLLLLGLRMSMMGVRNRYLAFVVTRTAEAPYFYAVHLRTVTKNLRDFSPHRWRVGLYLLVNLNAEVWLQ